MSEMPIVVLDPGHGGSPGTHSGGSSWNRAEGPNGLLEKNLVFDLAQRVAARVRDQARVELTRGEDANPSLAERASVAKRLDAALFLSLHLNGSSDPDADGTDVYVAPDAGPAARAFGHAVWRRVRAATGTARGGLGARDFGTIVTARHSPRTASCLAELAYLTHPRQARALAEEGYRNHIADALADAIREHVTPRAVASGLGVGDGSPFVADALQTCWEHCEQLRLGASSATAPNVIVARRVRTETGVAVDANPYAGIGKNEMEAVIRACFSARAMPDVLLALWAKEGSTRSVTAPVLIPQATSDANARSIFRSKVYYEDLGADHFLVTTRAGAGTDNAFDDSDSAAPQHETHFAQKVAALVTGRFLHEDIAGAINTELTVSTVNGRRAVRPSTRFYALSLLLVDALWARLQAATSPLLPSISDAMNYLQWNMGATSFAAFLRSADAHRQEPRHKVNGQPIALEQWTLHTSPDPKEYKQPRLNAIKFGHYLECYRPIFAGALNLIKPGIEDLQQTPRGTRAADREDDSAAVSAETLNIPTFSRVERISVGPDFKPMPFVEDTFAGAFGAATLTTKTLATEAQVHASRPGFHLFPDPASASHFFRVDDDNQVFDSLLFRAAGGNVEARLESVLCYPADPAHPAKLAPMNGKFPVAILIHGNLTPIVSTHAFTPTGPTVTVTLSPGNTITITPARRVSTAISPRSHTGFSAAAGGGGYLQEELARFGVVSMSISTDGANENNLNLAMRANYILQHLDQLRGFDRDPAHFLHNKLDFKRVALIGHSRGGDAVVTAVHFNAARAHANQHGIKSVVSISPTDFSAILPAAQRRSVETRDVPHYCVVYGSHDGDVSGSGDGAHEFTGCGFRLYDRSNTHRAMVFIHGANHNQFNRAWTTNDGNDPAPPLTRDQQEALAKEYVVGWVRYSVLGDWAQANLFNGTTANAHGVPVSLMWKFGRDLKTIERYQDTDATKNTLSGRVTKPAYVSEVEIDNENAVDAACVLPAGGTCHFPTFPHVDRVTKADPPTGTRGPLREEIPVAHQDFHLFTHLTFRVTKKYPNTNQTDINTAAFPDFSITLEDTAGHRTTVANAAILLANPRKVKPIYREFSEFAVTNRKITKCNLETWKVPLSLFTAAPNAVSLSGVRAVELDFNTSAAQPIYVDTISLVKL
jgi:N-acetylmuramoyl-L-alanine amidase